AGPGFLEDGDRVEPGQPDRFVVVGDAGGEFVLLGVAEQARGVVDGPQGHGGSVLLSVRWAGQPGRENVRFSTGPDSAALTVAVTSSASTSASPASRPSRIRTAISAGVAFGWSIPETMSVSMNPACTPTTWVFCDASSTR